ncbi:phosphate ABC transporter substrate-binding protein [Undibacterium sp. LX40W]|uniref:Phosphate ABC transporter substrate-binding protein n=1 Tax=Undibacterium nitidum TaxID=2762298 RepID=A0A923KP78_9BURK|nr:MULTISPECIES: phosphate ABC transporter substrate-binding protein [Undibacterium]MBC3881478.1 phosphate ABC transporter substrate-binding protein [Undibacterium nitidum]MBC3891740.1 phosphate ABC transporter substrate-binding protein [Undibacterium sp. LX40W]
MKTFSKLVLTTCLLACSAFASAENVIVVSAKSAVGSLSKEQVADLYLGNTKEFPGGGIALPLLPSSGATRTEFFDKVLGKNEAQAKAIWSRLVFSGKGSAPRDVADSAEAVKLIAANPSCIGVIEKSAVNASVKVVFAP